MMQSCLSLDNLAHSSDYIFGFKIKLIRSRQAHILSELHYNTRLFNSCQRTRPRRLDIRRFLSELQWR
jgi:hypothetical protein